MQQQQQQNFSDLDLARIFLDPTRIFVGYDFLISINLWGGCEGTDRNNGSSGDLPKFGNYSQKKGEPPRFKMSEILDYVDNLKGKPSPSASASKPTPPIAAETKRQRGRPTKLSLAAAAKKGGAI